MGGLNINFVLSATLGSDIVLIVFSIVMHPN